MPAVPRSRNVPDLSFGVRCVGFALSRSVLVRGARALIRQGIRIDRLHAAHRLPAAAAASRTERTLPRDRRSKIVAAAR